MCCWCCFVWHCLQVISTVNSEATLNTILHLLQSFPDVKRFQELHSIWVENISKLMPVKFVPMKNSRLCSKHFSADMFEKGYSQRTVLKPYAVPTIFNDCFDQVGCVLFIIFKVPVHN